MSAAPDRYLIVSCDGGGIRGLITARLLQQIQTQFPNFLPQVQLYAGTSTGSLIALGLASGLGPETMVQIYQNEGATIFGDPALESYFNPKYGNTGLQSVLNRFLPQPQQLLSELKRSVLVCTFQLDNPQQQTWSQLVLHNLPNSNTAAHSTVIDSALCSSAAPTYFPPYRHPVYGYCIDGGVVANNPATLALAMVLDPDLSNIPLENIWMLSLGTGKSLDRIPNSVVDNTGPGSYGVINWMWPFSSGSTPAFPLLTALLDGDVTIDTYQCQQILGPRFIRADITLTEVIALDDYEAVGKLNALVDTYIGKDGSPDPNWLDVTNWVSKNFT